MLSFRRPTARRGKLSLLAAAARTTTFPREGGPSPPITWRAGKKNGVARKWSNNKKGPTQSHKICSGVRYLDNFFCCHVATPSGSSLHSPKDQSPPGKSSLPGWIFVIPCEFESITVF